MTVLPQAAPDVAALGVVHTDRRQPLASGRASRRGSGRSRVANDAGGRRHIDSQVVSYLGRHWFRDHLGDAGRHRLHGVHRSVVEHQLVATFRGPSLQPRARDVPRGAESATAAEAEVMRRTPAAAPDRLPDNIPAALISPPDGHGLADTRTGGPVAVVMPRAFYAVQTGC